MTEPVELSGIARPVGAMQPKPQLVSGSAVRAIVPTSIEEAYRMAKAISAAGWAPKSYLINLKRPEEGFDDSRIVVGIMHGLELGLTPIAALQSIAVINGSPSIWGDGALAIVQASGLMEDFREEAMLDDKGKVLGYRCTAKRRGLATPITHTFTAAEAQAAGLLDKQGPWQQYRNRMLQMRARAWTLRAGFADVLRGLSIAEEAQDVIDVATTPVRSAPAKPRRSQAALDAFAGEPSPALGTTNEGQHGDEIGATG